MHTHILIIPELGVLMTIRNNSDTVEWEEVLPMLKKKNPKKT